MTSASKNDTLDDIMNKYDNTYHSTIKMILLMNTYIDFNKENNSKEDSKF